MRKILFAAAFGIGAILGATLDTAQAAGITDEQAAIIGRIAVDAVAYQRCGFPQPADMFAGMSKNGMTIGSITASDGPLTPVMVRTLDHTWARYKDHPADFCASVASTRAR
jgi:hypothetical protein